MDHDTTPSEQPPDEPLNVLGISAAAGASPVEQHLAGMGMPGSAFVAPLAASFGTSLGGQAGLVPSAALAAMQLPLGGSITKSMTELQLAAFPSAALAAMRTSGADSMIPIAAKLAASMPDTASWTAKQASTIEGLNLASKQWAERASKTIDRLGAINRAAIESPPPVLRMPPSAAEEIRRLRDDLARTRTEATAAAAVAVAREAEAAAVAEAKAAAREAEVAADKAASTRRERWLIAFGAVTAATAVGSITLSIVTLVH